MSAACSGAEFELHYMVFFFQEPGPTKQKKKEKTHTHTHTHTKRRLVYHVNNIAQSMAMQYLGGNQTKFVQ